MTFMRKVGYRSVYLRLAKKFFIQSVGLFLYINGHYPYTSQFFIATCTFFRSTFFSTSNKTSNLSSLVLDRHKKFFLRW